MSCLEVRLAPPPPGAGSLRLAGSDDYSPTQSLTQKLPAPNTASHVSHVSLKKCPAYHIQPHQEAYQGVRHKQRRFLAVKISGASGSDNFLHSGPQ